MSDSEFRHSWMTSTVDCEIDHQVCLRTSFCAAVSVVRMRRLALLLTTASLALAMPAGALAQNPFGPLPAPTPAPAPAPPKPVTNNSSGVGLGLAPWQQILILASAIVLIGGIGWAIVHDAHRAAPVEEPKRAAGEKPLSAHERERRQQAQRKKAKAARQQRKRNRQRSR